MKARPATSRRAHGSASGRAPRRRMAVALAAATLAVPVAAATAPTASADSSVAQDCGTALSATEVQEVITLSDTTTLTGTDPLARFDDEVSRNQQITAILVRHQDRRGLFAVGLDAMEGQVMQPLLHTTTFQDPAFGYAFTPDLLRHFLLNLHREFLGQATDPQWTRYYDLAQQCGVSPARVALAGYNAHLVVDVGTSLADVGALLKDAADYVTIDGALIQDNQLIVTQTKAAYGVDLGPVWTVMSAASPVVYTIEFVNGLALQIPPASATVQAEVQALWSTTDAAITLATS